MNKTEQLVLKITEGIQEKKGKDIVIADLRNIDDTICQYYVICQGNSPSHLDAIVHSVGETVNRDLNEKPLALDGLRNAQWVAMDFVDVVVHVFLPDIRSFYNLENLWADAKLKCLPNIE